MDSLSKTQDQSELLTDIIYKNLPQGKDHLELCIRLFLAELKLKVATELQLLYPKKDGTEPAPLVVETTATEPTYQTP